MVKKEKTKEKKKSKLKIIFISIGILILLLFITGYFLLIGPSEKVKSAKIQDLNGDVEVQINNNWIQATNDLELKENDKIKTNSGNVVLNFNNGILINLESNTELEISTIIEDKITLNQKTGTSWTKFINVLGVEEYEIETPNSVAIVRGTEFKISLNGTNTTLLTTDGQVLFKDNQNNEILVTKFKKANNDGSGVKSVKLTIEDKKEILVHKEKLLSQIQKLRLEEIYKNEFILNQIKKKYNWDDEKIEDLIKQIDNDEIDPSQYTDKIPFKIKNMDKILKYNDEIKDLINDIETLKNELENI